MPGVHFFFNLWMLLNVLVWIFKLCLPPFCSTSLGVFVSATVLKKTPHCDNETHNYSVWLWWVTFLFSILRIIVAPPTPQPTQPPLPVPFSIIKLRKKRTKSFHTGHTELLLNKTCQAVVVKKMKGANQQSVSGPKRLGYARLPVTSPRLIMLMEAINCGAGEGRHNELLTPPPQTTQWLLD